MQLIVLFSGPVASGKTSVKTELIKNHQFKAMQSSDHLKVIAAERGLPSGRATLIEIGDGLDKTTDYRWVVTDVAKLAMEKAPDCRRWLFDSIRKERQLAHFHEEFGERVLHVHLYAPEDVLRARYNARLIENPSPDTMTYEATLQHPNEIAARDLIRFADLKLDTSELSPVQLAAAVMARAPIG